MYQPVVSFADDENEERYQILMEILDGEDDKPLEIEALKLAPVAERTNLMLPLDKWSYRHRALSSLTERYQENQTLANLFVRVSGNSPCDDKVLRLNWRRQTPARTPVCPATWSSSRCMEEIAEKHFKEAKPFREAAPRAGLRVLASASFGGKANSERILNHLVPDYIKLDSESVGKTTVQIQGAAVRSEEPSPT